MATSWVITILDDEDKTDVGTITAVFTDNDGTTRAFSRRIQATLAQLNLFVTAAVADKNAWITRKTTQTSQMATAVTRFTAAGEVNVSAGISS